MQGLADQGTNKVGSTGETSSVVTLALFGLGRAGSIHLANIVANRKVELKYIGTIHILRKHLLYIQNLICQPIV